MSPKKKSEKVIVTEEMNLLVDEIKALVKVRDALSYGKKSGSALAESVMSRRINNRVIQLSEHILDTFRKDDLKNIVIEKIINQSNFRYL